MKIIFCISGICIAILLSVNVLSHEVSPPGFGFNNIERIHYSVSITEEGKTGLQEYFEEEVFLKLSSYFSMLTIVKSSTQQDYLYSPEISVRFVLSLTIFPIEEKGYVSSLELALLNFEEIADNISPHTSLYMDFASLITSPDLNGVKLKVNAKITEFIKSMAKKYHSDKKKNKKFNKIKLDSLIDDIFMND